MRAKSDNGDISVNAIAGSQVVILGMDFIHPVTSLPELSLSMMALSVKEPGNENTSTSSTHHVQCLGFFIERRDVAANEVVSLNYGGKPIQKLMWGDYGVMPGRDYVYTIYRMMEADSSPTSGMTFSTYGEACILKVRTEDPSYGIHGVFFNRGCAGSQAYATKFGEFRKFHRVDHDGHLEWKSIINPREIPVPQKSKEALAWLSRGLEEALLGFLSKATGKGYQIRAAVYEFTHKETLQAMADAVERGVDVKIIRHCKYTHHSGEDTLIPDDATRSAEEAIAKVAFHSLESAQKWQDQTFIERRHSSALMHNKFIVLTMNGHPFEVWTGSVNFTDSGKKLFAAQEFKPISPLSNDILSPLVNKGIYGQSNTGHIVRDHDVAQRYMDYWEMLSTDRPGRGHMGDSMDDYIEQQQPDLVGQAGSPSMHVIFSPRKSSTMLHWYADRMNEAVHSVHFTEAFSISQPIAEVLKADPGEADPRTEFWRSKPTVKSSTEEVIRRSPRIAKQNRVRFNLSSGSSIRRGKTTETCLRYLLLDSKPSKFQSDKSHNRAAMKGGDYADYYDFKSVKSNRISFGATIQKAIIGRVQESLTGLTNWVDFIHTKYMIIDALTENPTIITGSANFSEASTTRNDENMLIIQGDTSVADIYFTEFMRLFENYFFRDQCSYPKSKGNCSSEDDIVLNESWLHPYYDPSNQLFRERVLLGSRT